MCRRDRRVRGSRPPAAQTGPRPNRRPNRRPHRRRTDADADRGRTVETTAPTPDEEERRLAILDGLGANLAGMAMQVRAARKLLAEPARTAEILDSLDGDLRSTITDVCAMAQRCRG